MRGTACGTCEELCSNSHLRSDLESANARAEDATTQLQSAKEQLAEEVRLRTQLQQDLIDLKVELQGAQEKSAQMHSPGQLLQVEGDASMNERRDQVI